MKIEPRYLPTRATLLLDQKLHLLWLETTLDKLSPDFPDVCRGDADGVAGYLAPGDRALYAASLVGVINGHHRLTEHDPHPASVVGVELADCERPLTTDEEAEVERIIAHCRSKRA